MIFRPPRLSRETRRLLRELDEIRDALGSQASRPAHWAGRLRRSFRVQDVSSSVAIEGFSVPEADAFELVDRPGSVDPSDDDHRAVASYAHAMRHVDVLSDDPSFSWHERVLLDLHFDACFWQADRRPGRWRTGPIGVTRSGGGLAFTGPPPEDVSALMGEVVAWLGDDAGMHPVVRAAMAHLHVVSVHPFEDGNGRLARIVQSLVLAREGRLTPELGSIEEYLGAHTTDYYDALMQVQGGRYDPARSASAWVLFCIRAHLVQGRQRLSRIEEAGRRWELLEALVEERSWPDRLVIALEQGLFGRTDRARYGEEADVSPATATTDLRRLADAGLLQADGRGRSVHYRASDALRSTIAQD